MKSTSHKMSSFFEDSCLFVEEAVAQPELYPSHQVLPVVRVAEDLLAHDKTINFEYPSMVGIESFCHLGEKLLLGDDHASVKENRVVSVQVPGGSAARRVAAEFCALLGLREYCTLQLERCPHEFSLESNLHKSSISEIEDVPEKSMLFVCSCFHNTGLHQKGWENVLRIIKEKQVFPVIYLPFLGETGNPEEEVHFIRYLASNNVEFLVAQSFSKNFSIPGCRLGLVTAFLSSHTQHPAVKAQLVALLQSSILVPPSRGAFIVMTILKNPDLKKQWLKELRVLGIGMRCPIDKTIDSKPGDQCSILPATGRGVLDKPLSRRLQSC